MVDYSNIPRDSRRVPLETRVQFKFDRFDGFISEYSANISPGGLFLRTRAPQPPGTVLDFEFRLGDGFELIRGRGEVVWNRLEDEGPTRPAGMGLRFLELSEGSKDLIYRIVDQHVLHGGTPFDVTQRPPDPIPAPPPPVSPAAPPWSRPAAPAAARDVFDLPPPAPATDASSWLPSLDDAGLGARPSGEPFPHLEIPGVAVPPEPEPTAPPMFASTLGQHSSARAPRRKLPWALLAAGLVLAAALFLLRDRVMGWMGLGGEDEIAQAPPPPARPKKTRRALPATAPNSSPSLATAGSPAPSTEPPATPPASPAAGAVPQTSAAPPATSAVPAPAPKAPPAAAPSPAPAPAPAAKAPFPAVPEENGTSLTAPLTTLEKITFEAAGGGTDVILWGNGAIPASVYTQARIEGNPPRELFRLSGIRQPFGKPRLVVGTPEVLQIRTGFHAGTHGNEVHVVLDLANPGVKVTQVEPGPQRLRIHLQRK